MRSTSENRTWEYSFASNHNITMALKNRWSKAMSGDIRNRRTAPFHEVNCWWWVSQSWLTSKLYHVLNFSKLSDKPRQSYFWWMPILFRFTTFSSTLFVMSWTIASVFEWPSQRLSQTDGSKTSRIMSLADLHRSHGNRENGIINVATRTIVMNRMRVVGISFSLWGIDPISMWGKSTLTLNWGLRQSMVGESMERHLVGFALCLHNATKPESERSDSILEQSYENGTDIA
jgi:hypothetical protein